MSGLVGTIGVIGAYLVIVGLWAPHIAYDAAQYAAERPDMASLAIGGALLFISLAGMWTSNGEGGGENTSP